MSRNVGILDLAFTAPKHWWTTVQATTIIGGTTCVIGGMEIVGGGQVRLKMSGDVTVTIEGSDFSISASGKFRRLAAKGSGAVFLQGRGRYRTSGGRHGVRTNEGIRLGSDPNGSPPLDRWSRSDLPAW